MPLIPLARRTRSRAPVLSALGCLFVAAVTGGGCGGGSEGADGGSLDAASMDVPTMDAMRERDSGAEEDTEVVTPMDGSSHPDVDSTDASEVDTPVAPDVPAIMEDAPCPSVAHARSERRDGRCVIAECDPRYGDCNGEYDDGCEESTTTNADCGGCGVICAPSGAIGECSTGVCRVTACLRADIADCDGLGETGCETSLRSVTDCGACGVPCALSGGASSCATGVCQLTGCAIGLGNCDGVGGCEQMLDTLSHCGDCRLPCAPRNATASCAGGTCTIVRCNLGWMDVDGDVRNGCETPG